MVPKLHPKGKSFKGAAAYLLHDKGGKTTSERVAWTETRNLITRNPEAAWRVMAATAKDQERLKRLADVKSTGRKSNDSVLHLTLSWHPTEKVSREEMVRAAEGALRTLGAGDRQVMLVCHNDEPHPHVHLLINRVSPADGKMLSSSKEKLILSRWAEGYERQKGNVVCPERVKNNERRREGQYTRGASNESRKMFEQRQHASGSDRSAEFQKLRVSQQEKDRQLAKRSQDLRTRQQSEHLGLQQKQRDEMRIVRHKFHELRPRYLLRIEQAKLDRRDAFNEGQRQELVKFVQKEKSVLGRMANRFSTISFSTLLENKNGERSTLRHAFECLTSSAARVEAFKERQRREGREFEKELARSGRLMEKKLQAGFCGRLNRIRQSWREERVNLLSLHRDEKTKLELLWSHRHEERGKAYRVFGPKRDVTDENVNLTPKHPPHQVETRYQTLKREREEFLASRRENNRDRGRTRGLDE